MRSQYGYILQVPYYAALLDHLHMPGRQVLCIIRVLFQPDGHPVRIHARMEQIEN
jgi:hypothetical protein